MPRPSTSRRLLPSGLPTLKYSSCAPGTATRSKVGFGMYSEMRPRTAILVLPLTSTYWTSPSYFDGRWRVSASLVSYKWLSASKTSKSS